jgi:hypothetical protein
MPVLPNRYPRESQPNCGWLGQDAGAAWGKIQILLLPCLYAHHQRLAIGVAALQAYLSLLFGQTPAPGFKEWLEVKIHSLKKFCQKTFPSES